MNVPFVCDIGTGHIKAELAGSDAPVLHRTAVGFEKYSRPLHPSAPPAATTGKNDESERQSPQQQKKILLGRELDALRGVATISHPMEHGHVVNRDELEALLKHVVVDSAGIVPQEHSFVLTEPVATADAQRRQIAELFFEKLHAASVLFAVQPVLSLHATGRTTGLVVESGEGVTQTCAVFDGYAIRDAGQRVDFGGGDTTKYLQHLLRQHAGVNLELGANSERQALIDIKHALGVTLKSAAAGGSGGDAEEQQSSFTLPDGTEIPIPLAARTGVGELPFDPAVFGFGSAPLPVLARETIKKCDMGVRNALCESVHLAGGATLVKHFPERFAMELARLTPASSKVRVHASAARQHAAWHGGAILAQMSTADAMSVSRVEYREEGAAILQRKLFG